MAAPSPAASRTALPAPPAGQNRCAAAGLQRQDPRILVDRVGHRRRLSGVQCLHATCSTPLAVATDPCSVPIATVSAATLVPRQPTSADSCAQR